MNQLHIVLLEPQIPQNTGNIARTCAVTGAVLHLIRPLGFEINDKKMKRAGLDYWDKLDVRFYDDIRDFFLKNPTATVWYFTTKARHRHTDVSYSGDTYLMFGREDAGLPEDLLISHPETAIRIPMRNTLRSLNLSNAVAIAAYEVLRQWDFDGLSEEGSLTKYTWGEDDGHVYGEGQL